MKVRDQCGVCGGDGKSCLDCAGAVNGGELGDDGDCEGCFKVVPSST